MAYKNKSFTANFSANNGFGDNNRFQIQNLFYQQTNKGTIFTSGFLQSHTTPFMQTQTIAGVDFQSTLKTVRNPESLLATPVILYLPQGSQVSIFKNNQLIFSNYLSAGYQKIDTNAFPDGGYDLSIKIGSAEITHQFFSKTSILPPANAPQYYVTGGYLTNGMLAYSTYNNLPKVFNLAFIQSGINKRVTNNLASFIDVLVNQDENFVNVGAMVFYNNAYLQSAALLSSKGSYGFYTQLNYQKNKLSVNAVVTKVFADELNLSTIFLSNLAENDGLSFNYQVTDKDLLGVQGNYTRAFGDLYYSYGAGGYYQRYLGHYKNMGFLVNANVNYDFALGTTYYTGLTIQFNVGRFASNEAIGWQGQSREPHYNSVAKPLIAQGNMSYSKQNEMGLGYAFTTNHTISADQQAVAGTYNYVDRRFFTSIYANYNDIENFGSTLGYGGRFQSDVIVTKNGVTFNGLPSFTTTGIVARVTVPKNSAEASARFNIIDENNYKIGSIPANTTVLIPFESFIDKNLILVNASKSAYSIVDATRHITLYPGNIGRHNWRVSKQVIVIGRLVDEQHRPLTNAWVHQGDNGIFSDEQGYFQLEIPLKTKTLSATQGAHSCSFPVQLTLEESYHYMSEVVCVVQ